MGTDDAVYPVEVRLLAKNLSIQSSAAQAILRSKEASVYSIPALALIILSAARVHRLSGRIQEALRVERLYEEIRNGWVQKFPQLEDILVEEELS